MAANEGDVQQQQQQPKQSLALQTKEIFNHYTEQLGATWLAGKHWWIHRGRKLRMTYKDIQSACYQIVTNKRTGKGRGTILDALAETTSLGANPAYNEAERFSLQEMYFGMAILMMSLSFGEIVGTLWTEFTWAPQLGSLHALMIIVLLPVQIWIGLNNLPDCIQLRRSDLYIKLFFMGLSMGSLSQNNLMIVAPRMLSPMVLALMIEKFDCLKPKSSIKEKSQLAILEGRLNLFMSVAVVANLTVWAFLFMLFNLTIWNFLLSFITTGITLLILFTHFQLVFYAKCTLCERYQMEPMREDDPQHYWNLDSINTWLTNADLGYALAVLIMDVLLAAVSKLLG